MTNFKKYTLAELTNEQLIKQRTLLKAITTSYASIFLLTIAIFIYLLAETKFKTVSVAVIIPVCVLPIMFVPILISFCLIDKEIKSRNFSNS